MTARAWPAAVAVFLATAFCRFLLLDLTNDDLVFLAVGRQIAVFGDWPVRDLFEEGDPLHNLISAALQWLTGHSLAGEAVFSVAMLALAAALATLVAARLLRSASAGAFVGALTTLAWPRLYDYPKALLPAAAVWLCLEYQRRPDGRRAAALGALSGVSFLLRHDFGIYVAVTALVTLATTAWLHRIRSSGQLLVYAAVSLAIATPYVLFVQAQVGMVEYVAAAMRFTDREVSRSDDPPPSLALDWTGPLWARRAGVPVKVRWAEGTDPGARAAAARRYALVDGRVDQGRTWAYVLRDTSTANLIALVRDPLVEDTANIDRSLARGPAPPPPSRLRGLLDSDLVIAPGLLTHRNAVAWLYELYTVGPWLIATAIVLVLLVRRRRPELEPVLPPLAFCLVAAPLLLRGNLFDNSRLADFTTPAAILGSAVVGVGCRSSSRAATWACRGLAAGLVAVTALAVLSFGRTRDHVSALVTLVDQHRVRDESSRLWQALVAVPPPLDWVPREGGVRGAVDYLRQCTGTGDRVAVFGFLPDVIYFSGRAAAADRIVLLRGFGSHPDDERRTVAAMRRHPAAVVIVATNAGDGSAAGRVLDGLHPQLENYLVANFARVATTTFGSSTGAGFDVWINNRRHSRGAGPFRLPCLVSGGE